jgi:hypothetical protein
MSSRVEEAKSDVPKHQEKDKHGDSDSDALEVIPTGTADDVEKVEPLPGLDKETEKRLLRKLDRRIIPMVCWIYLMNFMDRGMYAELARVDQRSL